MFNMVVSNDACETHQQKIIKNEILCDFLLKSIITIFLFTEYAQFHFFQVISVLLYILFFYSVRDPKFSTLCLLQTII